MRAVVLPAPAGVDALTVTRVPRPRPAPGEAVVRVFAATVMSADLPTLDGVSAPGPGLPGPSYPMTPGNEFVGVVEECPGGELPIGQPVAVGFGGYGFTRDGGQAEYVLTRVPDLWPFESTLPWATLAALPKAFGSASMAMDALRWSADQTLFVRGGSTAIGLAVAALARIDGVATIGSTRSPVKAEQMLRSGFDQVVIDDGAVAAKVVELVPDGVDVAVEMLGYPEVVDSLQCVKPGGTLCMLGILQEQLRSRTGNVPQNRLAAVAPSPQWFVPAGVRLTTALQNGPTVMRVPDPALNRMQHWVSLVEAGKLTVPVQRDLSLDEVVDAYRLLEQSDRIGRIVLRVADPR